MRVITFILLISVSIVACNKPKQNIVFTETKVILTAENIFDIDMVQDYVFHTSGSLSDSMKTDGRKKFLKAIDLFKNKNKPGHSIDLFVQSILINPDAITYYELGNAYMAFNNYKKAEKAYRMAEELKFNPVNKLYYNLAVCVHKLNPDDLYDVHNYLRKAVEAGYSDSTQLFNNPEFATYKESNLYKELNISFAKMRNNTAYNFELLSFIKSFPDFRSTNFILDENIIFAEDLYLNPNSDGENESLSEEENYDRSNVISYSYSKYIPEMENVSYGRDVSNEFFYVARLKETSDYVAVVYKSEEYMGEMMTPANYMLTTYNNKGEIIAQKLIACSCGPNKYKTVSVQDSVFTIKDYKREWEKDLREVAINENKIKETILIKTEQFAINSDGKITPIGEPEIALK